MKRKTKFLIMAMLMIMLQLGSVMTAHATTITEASGDPTATATVTIAAGAITSTFTITVPNSIPMVVDAGAKTAAADFVITVQGDIAGTETLNISAIKTFNLTQAGVTNIPVTCTMSKNTTPFTPVATTATFSVADDGWNVPLVAADIVAAHNVGGHLSCSGVTSGAFTGTANFKASLT